MDETNTNPTPRPKKALGQNFLRDPNICRKIVGCLNIEKGDRVMEIGPGPGALTGFLLSSPLAELVLVEKDRELADARRAEAEEKKAESVKEGRAFPDVRVIEADALTIPYEDYSTKWKFIGNLPYNVASPLMWEIFSRSRGLERAVFMIQKEVGQRIVARPGSGAYGALSVWLQSFVEPRLEFLVPPHVFFPRPKVDSAVLSFTPCSEYEPLPDLNCLAFTIKSCFQLRRKQMGSIVRFKGNSLDNGLELLDKLGIPSKARPEDLDISDFHRLARSSIFCCRH